MKKVVSIFVTDTHLDKDNGELVKDIFDQLISLCKKHGVTNVIHGGDVFTNRSGQPLQCLTDWRDILKKLHANGITLHVIPGNHDKTDSNDNRSYLDVYSDPCMIVYDHAGLVRLQKNFYVGMIPYYKDEKWMEEYENLCDALQAKYDDAELKKGGVKILVTHSGFDGVKNNDGSSVNSIIKPKLFSNWTTVLVGHYHNASKLAENVIYTGSAYQQNYGENITDKGFTLIFEDGSTQFVASKFPKYIKHVIDATDKETLRNLIENYDDENRVDFVRFVFTGKKEDCQAINVAEIQSRYGIDCKFQSTETAEAIQLSEEDSVLCYDKKSIMKDFARYCSENEIRGERMKYGLELIKNC